MAISKIILNGVTQMDLTSDTVAANNLISPNTAHDAAGLPVVGTATAGMDIPVFTMTFDSDWEEVQSVICDKTLNECIDIFELNDGWCPAFVIFTNGTEESTGMAWGYEAISGDMKFALLPDFSFDIFYTGLEITTSMPFPSGYPDSVTIRQNGNYDPSDFDYRPIWGINVQVPSTAPTLQNKTVSYTPYETAQSQTITADSGYDGLDEVSVTVGAISSTYVGTGIARKSSSDLTQSNATITAPAGYYESAATKTVASGTEGTPTATKGTVSNHSVSVTPSVTNAAGYISGGTHSGTAVIVTASELASGNKAINANGTNIDVVGYSTVSVAVPSEEPNLQAKTNISPTTSSQTITADNGYDGLSSVQINAMPSGTAGTPTATKGSVSNHSISVTPSVTNTAGYITGGTKTGTAVTVSASELVSGTYTVDSSGTKDVTNYASASVPAGTAGTPSASKGTVSNHSVSITPSVTNTTGWITGGTKTGTAVTVTASELASGNKAIVDNGTNIDVVGYSTVSVAVPFSTIYTGTTDPSSSQGVNGDVYIKTS